MERTYIDTLAQLIARSPTCYHAAATAAELLAAAGYAPLDEGQRWQLRPGGKYYMTRGGSALIAFRVPEHAPAGFRLAAAHGDSPCFKLKENAALRDGGYLRLNTEVYGGLRMSSWFDRPLSVAGRLFTEENGVLRQTLVNIDRDLLVIPSVAIHFDRAANDGSGRFFHEKLFFATDQFYGLREENERALKLKQFWTLLFELVGSVYYRWGAPEEAEKFFYGNAHSFRMECRKNLNMNSLTGGEQQ